MAPPADLDVGPDCDGLPSILVVLSADEDRVCMYVVPPVVALTGDVDDRELRSIAWRM